MRPDLSQPWAPSAQRFVALHASLEHAMGRALASRDMLHAAMSLYADAEAKAARLEAQNDALREEIRRYVRTTMGGGL